MKFVRILIFVLLVPAFAFAQYKVVLKSGKVIEGKYLHEDQANIFIESNGIQMNFKKTNLDLEKMKELNVPAPQEITAPPAAPRQPAAPKAPAKKPVRVYTTEDLKQMKEIWDEGQEETSPTEEVAPVEPENEEPPAETPAPAESQTTPPAPESTPATPAAPVEAAQTVPVEPVTPAEPVAPPEPVGPRDEKTIRDEIESVNLQIAETEKMIQDLKTKGRVTETWEKLVVKKKQRLSELQQELRDSIAARRAAKRDQQQ